MLVASQLDRRRTLILFATGAALCGGVLWVRALSSRFEYGSPMLERPHLLLVAILMAMGVAYLVAAHALVQSRNLNLNVAIIIVLVGLFMRAAMAFSTPVQEDDFYRYLWDGALTANVHNPYGILPHDLGEDESLAALAMESGSVHARVNHGELGTIYPPTAQGAFALAHLLKPWSLAAWRTVLFGFDLATALLVLLALRQAALPLAWVGIYWWNPILVKETFNSLHMDIVVLPCALLAMLCASASRPGRAVFALVLAIGAKVWPVILAPLMFRAIRTTPRHWMVAGIIALLLTIAMVIPVLDTLSLGEHSGFRAYGEHWEMNDALFMIFAKSSEFTTNLLNFEESVARIVARVVAFLLLLAWTLHWSRSPVADSRDLAGRIVLVMAALFMLSPTQYPWYYVWIVPFLALSPRPSMLVLSAMLPMYYLKFYFDARDNVHLFHNGLVWLEYAPVFALAVWETRTRWRATPPEEVA